MMDVRALMDTATGYWSSAALQAALETGLFEQLAAGPATADALAAAAGTSLPHTTALLDALCGLGVLEKECGCYVVTSPLQPFLAPASPVSLLDALRYNGDLYPLWGRLADCLRTGGPVTPPEAHLGDDPARTERFVKGMYSRGKVLAPVIAGALDLEGRKKLLDTASGPGVFGSALAEKYPGLNVTLFDLPAVLDNARTLLEGAAVFARLSFAPGDYHGDDLPQGFDAALYCGALHQESEDDALDLFGKLHRSLEPGGILYVVDLFVDESGTQPAFSALFSLNMMLTRPSGHVYTRARAAELLARSHFRIESAGAIPQSPYGMIRALKDG